MAIKLESAVRPESPLVSVVIPTRNRAPMLVEAVSAVSSQDLSAEIELFVVDDDSSDETEAVMRQVVVGSTVPITYIRLDKQSGPAVARNAALAEARGDYVAFTDDDCVPSPGWLSAALVPFSDPRVGIVQGRTLGTKPSDWFLSRHVETHSLDGTFATANIVYRSEALAGQAFDPACSRGQWEDTDLGWRVSEAGWEARFAPLALVRHQILPMTAFDWVRWPWHYYVWCANVARHPGVRRHLFLGVWVRPMHVSYDLALVGLALSKWRRAALVLTVPYAMAFVWKHNVRPPDLPRKVLLYLARDTVAFGSLVAGSVRHRVIVL